MIHDSRPGPKPKRKTQPFNTDVLRAVPKAPGHLSDAAKAHWPRCAKPLVAAGGLCAQDLVALSELCEELAAAESMRRRAESDGWCVIQPNGLVCKHPCLQDLDRAGKRIAVLFRALAMTPAGRAELPPVEPKQATPSSLRDEYEGDFAT